jgi:Tol biopolymer transport system component
MGDVYRARDTRLQRDVAVKVLPDTFAADPERLARFEREALAVAALSHPGILAIHDFGRANGVVYAVMELLEGETLRARLDSGPLASRRAIDVAAQIARALAAAHEKGIVHRDIKPENIFLTGDGRVKVLDFGLARLSAIPAAAGASATRLDTAAGVVLGTVGYMSPEQVRGGIADHRSDIFSFGVVLYEMLTGARPFRGDSAVETMNAILNQDPPPLVVTDQGLAPALASIVDHCLEKEPGARFQSAQDLAFNLDTLRGRSDQNAAQQVAARRRPRWALLAASAAVALLAVALSLAAARWRTPAPAAPPSFTRLTYDQGTLWNARFAPDGRNVVFGAAWNSNPIRTFISQVDRTGAAPLSLPDAALLSVSASGELAVSLGHVYDGWLGDGTLARTAMLAGAPRPMVEHVREADWAPDGSDLAVVRRAGGLERLEFPFGKVLYETSGYISHIRFSRDGRRIAFADHPLFGDDNGDIAVVDLSGNRTTLAAGLQGLRGVAWSPDGQEVWFTAQAASPYAGVALRASTLGGRTRTILALPIDWRVLDVTPDGRVLMSGEVVARQIELWQDDRAQPHDLTMFDQSLGGAVSNDGKSALIVDQGNFAGTTYATYLRRLDRPEPVRLGDGQAVDFSADEKWALSIVYGPPSRLLLLPVGAGQVAELPNPQKLTISAASFLPGSRRVVFLAGQGREALRGYVQEIESGKTTVFTEPGVYATSYTALPVSPDGSQVSMLASDGHAYSFPVDGGQRQPLRGILDGERLIRWSADGRAIYVSNLIGVPQRLFRVDLATGRRTLHKELNPSQTAGIRRTELVMTADGRTVLFSFSRLLASLYVVEGIS